MSGHGGECFIVCTQPRRISAMSVAERVSNERVDKIGQSVGYQVRLENKQVNNFTAYIVHVIITDPGQHPRGYIHVHVSCTGMCRCEGYGFQAV